MPARSERGRGLLGVSRSFVSDQDPEAVSRQAADLSTALAQAMKELLNGCGVVDAPVAGLDRCAEVLLRVFRRPAGRDDPADAGLPPVDEALVFGRRAGESAAVLCPQLPTDLGEAEDQLAVHGQVAANRSAVRLLSGRREGVAGGQDGLRQCGLTVMPHREVGTVYAFWGGSSPEHAATVAARATPVDRDPTLPMNRRRRRVPRADHARILSMGAGGHGSRRPWARGQMSHASMSGISCSPHRFATCLSPPPSAKPGRLRPPAPLSQLRTATRALPQSRS